MRYVAHRSILLDGHLYEKGDIIECAMKRGRADLFIKTKAISKIDDECETAIVTTPVEDTKTVVPQRGVAPILTRKKT